VSTERNRRNLIANLYPRAPTLHPSLLLQPESRALFVLMMLVLSTFNIFVFRQRSPSFSCVKRLGSYMTKRGMSRRGQPIDRGRERYERGYSPEPYHRYDRQDPRYRRSPPITPRSPDDYRGRRDHLSPRSAGHRDEPWGPPRRPRSQSRSRSQHRRRSSSRGPLPRSSNRSRSRGPRNGPPSPREHHRSTSGYGKPPDDYRGPPRSPATSTNGVKGPETTRPWGTSGTANTST
jgi:hypothetical protein